MKLKLYIAGWIARRIEKRSRAARRALRDYQRQDRSRIRHDEQRTRGLRLYIGWSQPAAGGQHVRAKTASDNATTHLGNPQLAH